MQSLCPVGPIFVLPQRWFLLIAFSSCIGLYLPISLCALFYFFSLKNGHFAYHSYVITLETILSLPSRFAIAPWSCSLLVTFLS